MSGLSAHLQVALVAVAVTILVPGTVWAVTADLGPSAGVAVATLLVTALAVVAGVSASIVAIVRRERFGWITLAATLAVPVIWLALLILMAIS